MEQNGSKILIIDDDKSSQKAVESLLLNQGFQLQFADNGRDGLHYAIATEPDLILLDVMMPEMDGYEVCLKIRDEMSLAEVPILMISALDDRESRIRAIEAGVDDFISKPFDRTELRARVRTILRLNRYRKLREEHALLENALVELEAAYDQTIEGWVKALDIRDRETEGHTRRVTEMTIQLARMLGVSESELVHVRRGALLHDIGKLGVPDSILHKPGKLTPEEWDIMKLHTIHAYEWLYQVEYLHPAIDIPYYHHEKWDGSGYPLGLAGTEIPLSARCFAIADVWDALCSERPYKKAWPKEKAIKHIESQKGTHFDPDVVDAFLKIVKKEEVVVV